MKGTQDADNTTPPLGVPSIPDEFKLFLDWKVSTLLLRNNSIWLWFDIFLQGIPSTWKKNREGKGCCLDISQCHTVQNKSRRLLELAWCMPAPTLTKASGPALLAHLSQSKWPRNPGPKNPHGKRSWPDCIHILQSQGKKEGGRKRHIYRIQSKKINKTRNISSQMKINPCVQIK